MSYHFTAPWQAFSGLLLLSILLVGCGPSKLSQCKEILSITYAAQKNRQLGTQDQATTQANADNYGRLAQTLIQHKVSDRRLKRHVMALAESYRELEATMHQRVTLMDANGSLSYSHSDVQKRTAIEGSTAREQQAYQAIGRSSDQLYVYCNQ